jgi:transcriptional regulator with XRE-family HTH domain
MAGRFGSGGSTVMRGFDRVALRRLRIEAGMRQADLAEATGIQRAQIARYEADGGPVPQLPALHALAAALGVPASQLLTVNDDEVQLADLRYLAGLTQRHVAETAGLARSTYAALERGLLRLNDEWIEPLARALDTSADRVRTAHRNTAARAS